MTDPLAPVVPGDISPLLNNSAAINAVLESARRTRQTFRGASGKSPALDPTVPTVTVYVRNDTGGTLSERSIVKLGDPVISATGAPLSLQDQPTFAATAPTGATDTFAVTLVPLSASGTGNVGLAAVLGVVVCDLVVNDNAHEFAAPGTSTAALESAESGPAKVIWKNGSSGTQRAVVLIDGQSFGGVTGTGLDNQVAIWDGDGTSVLTTSGVLVTIPGGAPDNGKYRRMTVYAPLNEPGEPQDANPCMVQAWANSYNDISGNRIAGVSIFTDATNSGGLLIFAESIPSVSLYPATITMQFLVGSTSPSTGYFFFVKRATEVGMTFSNVVVDSDMKFLSSSVGPVLRSPDTNEWRITVTNAGVLEVDGVPVGGISASSPNTFTATQTFAPAVASDVAVVLDAHASQTANLLTALDASGDTTFRLDATGAATATASTASTVPMTIIGAVSQSANLLELKDDGGDLVLGVGIGSALFSNVDGEFEFAGNVDATSFSVGGTPGGTATTGGLTFEEGLYTGGTATAASDSFKTIAVSGQSDVVADSATDTLTLVAGTGITLTTNAGTDTITITGTAGLPSQTGNEGKFLSTDGSSAAWSRTVTFSDSGTNTVGTVLELSRETTGTAASGLGGRLQFNLEDNAGAMQPAARVVAKWLSTPSSSRVSGITLYAYDGSTETPVLSVGMASTGVPGLQFFSATLAAQQSGEVGAALQNYQMLDSALPLFAIPYVCLRHELSQNTNGGTFTSGSWQTRPLNTESSDTAGICALSSNAFTLSAGTYIIRARATAWRVNAHQLRLQNTTDATTIITGTGANSNASAIDQDFAFLEGKFTVAASKALELQHQCKLTGTNTGFGQAANITTEVYCVVELFKVG